MKNKFLVMLAVWSTLMCLPTMAQTDVTSKYIHNADFSAGWSDVDIQNNTVAAVEAWQGKSTGDTWFYSGAIGYASGKNVNEAHPDKNPAGGTDGGALGMSIGWGCTVQYTQEITLPAGVYALEYTYYNTNAKTQATNLMGYIDANGVGHYGTTNNFVSGQWTTEQVNFTVSEISTGKISLGLGAISGGSGDNAKVFVDHIRLLKAEDATTAVNTSGWGGSGNYSADGVTGSEVFQWAASLPLGVRMSQNVNLPDGKYRVEMYAMASSTSGRDNTSNVITDGSTEYVSLHVGDQSIGIPAYNREAFDVFDSYVFECVDVSNGVLSLSLNEDKPGPNWLVMQIKSLTYLGRPKLGDVNMSGVTDIADVTELVNIILGKSTDKYKTGNINQQGTIDIADVTELVNIILGKTVTPQHVMVKGVLHALQDGSNALIYDEVLDEETADPVSNYDMQNRLTQIAVNVPMSNIASVSIYSKDHSPIAGGFRYLSRRNSCSTSGTELTYASNSTSDVICVTDGNDGVYTAQLLPGNLTGGITVTVRTTDGKFYSQDFSDIISCQENNLTFTQTVAENLWMTTIPGTTYFSMVSTPGAHDACTKGAAFGVSAECQELTLQQLLDAGVRQFDIRPGYFYNSTITADNLYIWHGQISTGVLYKDAIATLVDFLKAHPSEALSIIMVKENNKPTINIGWSDRSAEMWAVVNAVQEEHKAYMKVLDHSYYTLDDFRGKICYVNRTGTSVPYTTQISNWPDDKAVTDYSCIVGLCNANVQDIYSASGATKQGHVKSMLDMSSGNTDHKHFYYNYCSSAGSPKTFAKSTNPAIATYIDGLTGPTGYILADYIGSSTVGGDALLRAVVEQNYKYVFQGR